MTACTIPPAGWSCSRAAGHDGPCAATPAPVPATREGWRGPLETLVSFVSVMTGYGADCIVPEEVRTPLGIPVKLGAIIREANAALAASPSAPQSDIGDGWRTDMEAAPRDRMILLGRPGKVMTGKWFADGATPGFYSGDVGNDDISVERPATAWRDLPAAPTVAQGEGK